jgi:molecular chaperone HscA
LAVHARETTTGLEQHVTVKPTYGLDDATVERMLMDALDHGHEDLARRKLAESRVEGHRILSATRRALDTDADLLSAEENATVALACAALERTIGGEQASAIALEIDALDRATQTFAARRMNRAMARAIGGRRVDSVEKAVEHAKGIEYAHGPGPTPGQVA